MKKYNYIKNLQEDDKGVVKSNIKGWHSNDFDMKDTEVINLINLLSAEINRVIKDMDWDINNQTVKILNMWSIVNTGGASNARHHHGNSDISAAYYVRAPKNCGDIVFYDPRPAPVFSHPKSNNPNSLNCMVNSITPVEGSLVLFQVILITQ